MKFISLFSGGGGLDLGLERAGLDCRFATDHDPDSVATLLANRGHELGQGRRALDDAVIALKDVRRLNGKNILSQIGHARGEIPVLAGGPPCQSWSSGGKQLGYSDPRGRLVDDYLRIASEVDARWLIFENVRGLLTARGVDGRPGSALEHMRSMLFARGWQTHVELLNAADFGVPQRRVRLIVIGYRRGDVPLMPVPTYGQSGGQRHWKTLGSCLSELSPIIADELIRPSGKMADDLAGLRPGTGAKSAGKAESTRPGGHWGYKQGAFVADQGLPARTVTASSQQDWIIDNRYGLRRLTPRECAAIQTFPPEWRFVGNRASQYRQIGNAVPPVLARAIGSAMMSHAGADAGADKQWHAPAPLAPRLQSAIDYTAREREAQWLFTSPSQHSAYCTGSRREVTTASNDAETAEALYVASLASGAADADWASAVTASRKRVLDALRASDHLQDIEHALKTAGEHLAVFRYMFGPPLSQDQFALICPAYRKACENSGKRVGDNTASVVAAAIPPLLDPKITPWLRQSRNPTRREIRHLVATVAPMLSLQVVATVRRNRLSLSQETAVIDLLAAMGWTRMSSGLVDQSVALPARHFMHKTRFATQTRPQEVDIACGLGTSVVLAMECKVTNDRTNSVKRVNDILKKATAWQLHWGSFVRTAALLQGVIAEKDVQRLVAANVQVFWSHDLERFRVWLGENCLSTAK